MAAWHGQVETREWLTPSMVRVVLGGPGLTGFVMPDATDTYVNVAIPPAGAPYDAVFEPAAVREAHPQELWPVRRRYTVRSWDEATGRLTLDFVVHGDAGIAGPWAAAVAPGDVLVFEGPGSGYRPDPDADWHLMVGDESALPAIAASLEAVPAGTPRRGPTGLRRARPRGPARLPRRPRPAVAAPHRRGRRRRPARRRGVRPRLPRRPRPRLRPRRGAGDPRWSAVTCSPSGASTGATCRARRTGAAR